MQKTFSNEFRKNILILTILCFGILKSVEIKAQPPKPNMWVDSTTSLIEETNFNVKRFLLTNYIRLTNSDNTKKETASIFFPVNSFQSMIQYFESLPNFNFLGIYIASYGKEGSESVPAGLGNLLTIIFAPESEIGSDLGYYTIPPGGNFDPNSCKLSADVFRAWREVNYLVGKMPILLQTIDNIPDNRDNNGIFSDTKFVLYPEPFIKQLITEIGFQKTNGPGQNGTIISGVRAFFSAFTENGNANDSNRFPNRLLIQFEFTKHVGNTDVNLYLESTPGWQQRAPKLKHIEFKQPKFNNMFDKLLGLDNGQLCPPYNCK